jgi:ribonuclease HI
MYAWGCINETTGECTRDTWSEIEQQCHINYLELKAGFLSIKHFCKNTKNCHIQLYMDNTVAVTYINKMGGKIKTLNDLTRQIWHWCIVKNIWISACHVAGVENKEADFLSRDKNSDMEWMLNTEVFQLVQKIFGIVILIYLHQKIIINYQNMFHYYLTNILKQLMHLVYLGPI